MARKAVVDYEKMTPFARWLVDAMEMRGKGVTDVADHVDMSASQMHKIIKSYRENYASYQRPGFEKTRAIGEYLGDVRGALLSAGYEEETPADSESDAQMLRDAEILYAAGFSELPPSAKRAVLRLVEDLADAEEMNESRGKTEHETRT